MTTQSGDDPSAGRRTLAERSLLFVPADRPERYEKALRAGADCVIIDLEDAVSPEAKVGARDVLANWLNRPDSRAVCVRINGVDTPWHRDDLGLVRTCARAVSVMLPKTESRDMISSVADAALKGRPLIALIETARGFLDLRAFAGTPGLSRLAFGSVDFCAQTGMAGSGSELDAVRTELVLVSSASGLAAPIEGVTLGIADGAALVADIERARRFGFGGKLCIHPAQVDAVNHGFSPKPSEIDWARRVIASIEGGHGAVSVDGMLVDRPVVEQARAILQRAHGIAAGSGEGAR